MKTDFDKEGQRALTLQDKAWKIAHDATSRGMQLEAENTTLRAKLSEEPCAARYDFDGYGWRYIDSGAGSDWKARAARYRDCEWLYNRSGT